MKKNRIVEYAKIFFIVGICTLMSTNAFAEERPLVLWDNQVVYAVDRTSCNQKIIADNATCQAIGKLINEKITSLNASGRLPFKPIMVDEYQNNDIASKLMAATSNYIALVPVILSDSCIMNTINLHGKTWYKYEVVTSLSLMFCAVGQEGVHIIYNVPMYGIGWLGDKFEHNLNSSNPIMNKIDMILKKQVVRNAKDMIDRMTFPPEMVSFLTEENLWKKTCQVDSVDISPIVRKNLGNTAEVDNLPSIVAKAFGSAYVLTHPDRIMLPDKASGNAWKDEVARHINPNLSSAEFDEACNNSIPIKILVENFSEAITKQNREFKFGVTNVVIRNLTDKKVVKGKEKFERNQLLEGDSSFPKNYDTTFGLVAIELAQK